VSVTTTLLATDGPLLVTMISQIADSPGMVGSVSRDLAIMRSASDVTAVVSSSTLLVSSGSAESDVTSATLFGVGPAESVTNTTISNVTESVLLMSPRSHATVAATGEHPGKVDDT